MSNGVASRVARLVSTKTGACSTATRRPDGVWCSVGMLKWEPVMVRVMSRRKSPPLEGKQRRGTNVYLICWRQTNMLSWQCSLNESWQKGGLLFTGILVWLNNLWCNTIGAGEKEIGVTIRIICFYNSLLRQVASKICLLVACFPL